jgi:glucose-1-phosphate thymidylyltransferase
MRALVLAGGEGSRLRPITHTNAKQLIPVAGTPILFHALSAISDAGIIEVAVVVGPPNEDEVRAAVGDGSRWGLDLVFIHQPAPRGIANAVTTAAEFVRGTPFLLYLGDNVLLEGVTRFVEEFERTGPDAQIFLARVAEPQHFGVAVLEGERVVRLVEKPKDYVSDIALVGVYLFRDSILDACETLRPSWRNEYEITEAIQWLIDHGHTVRAELVSGWWKDTGKPEDLLEANRMMLSLREGAVDGEVDAASVLEGTVMVSQGAKVTHSTVLGPVVIGPDTIVDGSTVGPNVSLERGCRIVRSGIEDSIVMEASTIEGVRGLTGSILGRGAQVRHSGGDGTYRLIVGDQSRIEVD